jgi:hypothetical protein
MVSERSIGERMMKIETKIINIEEHLHLQSKILEKMSTKLDCVVECKADKTDLELLRGKVNTAIFGSIGAVVGLLLGITGFLLKKVLFG